MPYALCALRDVEVIMPAIASLEDLKSAQRDDRSKFLIVTTNASRLAFHGRVLTLCSGLLLSSIFLSTLFITW